MLMHTVHQIQFIMNIPLKLFFIAFLFGVCYSAESKSGKFISDDKLYADTPLQHPLIKLMKQSADDWNKGNLNGFMSLYDDSATMMTGDGLINKDSMMVGYSRSYFKNGKPQQQLNFDQLQILVLDEKYVLLTGRFVLNGNNLPMQSGRFSLLCVLRKNGWKILHDHTS